MTKAIAVGWGVCVAAERSTTLLGPSPGTTIHQAPNAAKQYLPRRMDTDVAHRLLEELGEKDAEGNVTLGGCKVHVENATVSCLWKGVGTNRVAEEFALRMQRETGCVIVDVGGYRVVDPVELVGPRGQSVDVAPSAIADRDRVCQKARGARPGKVSLCISY